MTVDDLMKFFGNDYSLAEIAKRIGYSKHSLYKWSVEGGTIPIFSQLKIERNTNGALKAENVVDEALDLRALHTDTAELKEKMDCLEEANKSLDERVKTLEGLLSAAIKLKTERR